MSDQALVREITTVASRARFRANQVLFVEGMPANTLYVVFSGQVKVYRTATGGKEQIIHLLGEDDLIAVVPFFDRGPYPANAEVTEDAELGCLSWDDMEKLVEERPALLLLVAQHFAGRLRAAQTQIATLGLQSSFARVAHLLMTLGEQFGRTERDGIAIRLDLTRRDLGSCVGLSRETTTRILTDLKNSGTIAMRRRDVVLQDVESLRNWARM